ncbi:ParB/RepB/Spo0J family partition protein [Nocardioides carbamazepini]|uniref:ParB/RepB/Spo0J family partition protein n=1 Tax=Nocardioides carbamazepini TaxID=2854259 RepID=UPI002149FD55|nr:ParB/RepB/Spo0J family partition protein [Nocardioides carbamazepini]MCR1785911.1 ParB/RepB/Spo0J family partition protein [Nocardioides carbamazepini]
MADKDGRIELERSIDSIVVGVRHRKDLGDIDALMRSIQEIGLVQPITITPDGVLVCGARRLEALRRLGERTLKVWVRSGVSDELSRLLAQQDENALHKPLSPLEAETLFREAKRLLAEEAQRRQEATRFGSSGDISGDMSGGLPRDHSGDMGEVNGAGGRAGPQRHGDSRAQAAKLVTGAESYKRLEQIGWLKRLADDTHQRPHLRGMASAALEAIENGGAVEPAYKQVKAAVELDTTHPGQPQTVTPDELERLAAEALERVRQNDSRKGVRALKRTRSVATHRSVRSFILTWTELDGWAELYDIAELARELTDEEWQRFERVVADSAAFAQRLHEARIHLTASA